MFHQTDVFCWTPKLSGQAGPWRRSDQQRAARFTNLPFNRAVTLPTAIVLLTASVATVVPVWLQTLGWVGDTFALVIGGTVTALVSFVVLCLASRCTSSGYKLFWHAVSKRGHGEALSRFMFGEACPNCGSTRTSGA